MPIPQRDSGALGGAYARAVSESPLLQIWKLALLGLAAGLLGGTMGVGGGIIMVPLLVHFGFDRHSAHATSLAAIVLIGSAGAASYLSSGASAPELGVTIGIGGILGSVIGTSLMHRFSARTLTIVFGLVILAAAIRMISGASPLPGASDLGSALTVGVATGIGLIAGLFAGIAGIGGGLVIVPSSVLLLGLEQHEAQGTSLVAIIFTSISGTLVNLRNERVRPRDGLAVGLGGVGGSVAGAQFALGVEPRTLSLVFGFLVLFVALRTLYRGLRAEVTPV